jgi:hypothetical protein
MTLCLTRHTLHDPDYELQRDSGDASSDNGDVIDHEEVVETNVNVETDVNVPQKRAKKKSECKRKTAKRLRMEGEKYKCLKKVDGKWGLQAEKNRKHSDTKQLFQAM